MNHVRLFAGRHAWLALPILGLIAYANSLPNALVWDDLSQIADNAYLTDWRFWPRFFTQDLLAGAGQVSDHWRPLVLFIWAVGRHLWDLWPAGFRLINIGLHVANGLLAFALVSRLFRNRALAWLVAAVFLLHPVQTEAVSYVSGLADPLCSLFILSGLVSYLRYRTSGRDAVRSGYYWLSLLAGVLALFSKESAVIYPGLAALVGWRLSFGTGKFTRLVRSLARDLWPHLALAIGYLALRLSALNFYSAFNLRYHQGLFTESLTVRLFAFGRALTGYLEALFLPFDLRVEYLIPDDGPLWSFRLLAGLAFLTIAAFIVVRRWHRYPTLSFGLAWFFLALLPVSNLVAPANDIMAEHWLYLPMIGLALPLVRGGQLLSGRLRGQWKVAVILVIGLFVAMFGLTVDRNRDWRDSLTLWEKTVADTPNSYRALNNLGNAYQDNGRLDEAETIYRQAASLEPNNPIAYMNLGNLLRQSGQADEAYLMYRSAARLAPETWLFQRQYSSYAFEIGRRQEAVRALEDYAERQGAHAKQALIILGKEAFDHQEIDQSLEYLEQARRLAPDDALLEQTIRYVEGVRARQ